MPRLSRTVAHQEDGFPEAGLRAGVLPSQSRLTPCQLPRRGSRVSSPPEACRRPSLASPFGGRWCPVGTVQRLTEPAGESAPVGGGEGQPQVAPGPKIGKWHCWAQTRIKPGFLNSATWHCSQSRINTGFFANIAKFSSQAVGRREGRSLLGEIDKF